MADERYESVWSGTQIDAGIGRIINGDIDAEAAAAAASAAQAAQKAQEIQAALDNIPAGAIPIVNNLTTGGTSAALSAQQGVVIKGLLDGKVSSINGNAPGPGGAVTIPAAYSVNGVTPNSQRDIQLGPHNVYARPNRSLLPNGYLLGDGTAGKFPINQRGRDFYSGSGYMIDMWKSHSGGFSLSPTESGLEISYTASSGMTILLCPLPELDDIAADTALTFSVLLADGNLYSITKPAGSSGVYELRIANKINMGVFGKNSGYSWATAHAHVSFITSGNVSGLKIKVAAAKLEMGSQQTLAHRENGAWVLNEIPDYAEELAKCQRYLKVLSSPGEYGYFGMGRSEGGFGYIMVPCAPLRKDGSLSISTGDSFCLISASLGIKPVTSIAATGEFSFGGYAVLKVGAANLPNTDSLSLLAYPDTSRAKIILSKEP